MEHEILKLSYTLASIDDAAKEFSRLMDNKNIFAFSGDMGAGKTTFIHYLCDHLQVQDVVGSPTFALINEYRFNDSHNTEHIIYHLDWYRLRDTAEAINAGMEDCLIQARKGNAYCFIEWPEKATELLTPPYVMVNIESITPEEREMTVKMVNVG